MPATTTHCFFQYTLRPAAERDYLLAELWTGADPWHRGIDPLFWLDQGPLSESYLLSDKTGPVYFFKMMRTPDPHIIELHIQFPSPVETVRTRVMISLVVGFEWLESVLIPSGITTVYFESQSPKLIEFCIRRLGFQMNGKWLIKSINRGTGDVRTFRSTAATPTRTDELLSERNL